MNYYHNARADQLDYSIDNMKLNPGRYVQMHIH